jgi:hypothetical protein
VRIPLSSKVNLGVNILTSNGHRDESQTDEASNVPDVSNERAAMAMVA